MTVTTERDLPARLEPSLRLDGPARLPRFGPDRWHGYVDCLVGPFSCRAAADRFAHRVVDFGLFDVFAEHIASYRDGWYIEVRPVGTAG